MIGEILEKETSRSLELVFKAKLRRLMIHRNTIHIK